MSLKMVFKPHLLVDPSLKCGVKERSDPLTQGRVLTQEPGGVADVRPVGSAGLVGLVSDALRPHMETD